MTWKEAGILVNLHKDGGPRNSKGSLLSLYRAADCPWPALEQKPDPIERIRKAREKLLREIRGSAAES